jgi:C4-dicarboxylate transporter DctM subunit
MIYLIVGSLFLFLALGVPVAFSLAIVSVLGLIYMGGPADLVAIADISWSSTSEFLLVAIPLFILMSEIIDVSGVGRDLFRGVERWMGGLPGGVAMSTVVASAVFGAVSGTAVGVAAVMSSIAIPEMLKRNFSKEMASGTVAASSGLGMVIPPSLPLIVYGVVTETSIERLFYHSLKPGLIIVAIFCFYIFVMTWFTQKKTKSTVTDEQQFTFLESIYKSLPIFLLIIAVLGSIYVGFATPTEAAAVGVFGALLIAFFNRTLTLKKLYLALYKTAHVSSMLLIVMVAAMVFSYMLSVAQVPQNLTQMVVDANLQPWLFMTIIMLLLFVLGFFLDAISVVLISVPILFPSIIAYGYDPVWFGVVLMVNMCFAVVTPPVGLCLYVVRDSVASLTLSHVIKGVIPYIILYTLSIALFMMFPGLIIK